MDDSGIPPIFPTAQSEHFETERLVVRQTTGNDLGSLKATLEDPELAELFGRDEPLNPEAFIDAAVAGWESQVSWTFTIIEKATQRVVGFTGVSLEPREGGGWQAEPVIAITRDSRRRHYADEAMRGLIAWSFSDLDCPPGITLDEVRGACVPSNTASLYLLESLADIGMKDLGEQEVTVRRPGPGEPRTKIAHVFSIIREDYK